MPEIPDIEAYIEALRPRIVGETLLGIRLANPFLLRTVEPPLGAVAGGRIEGIERLGKRIVLEVAAASGEASLDARTRANADRGAHSVAPDAIVPSGSAASSAAVPFGSHVVAVSIFIVVHLMIAGRLHWKERGSAIPKGSGLAAFDFVSGTLVVTEAGKKRRASLRLVKGREDLVALDPGGLEVVGSSLEDFEAALRRENRIIKRVLTDPHTISGIGNAYSDEILHRARMSPLKQTRALEAAEIAALHAAATEVLEEWTERLRAEARKNFPEKVTAFRPEMAVHGRFGLPCPDCGAKVQRIVYAENECNYCPDCQTKGRILADRALSRLLKDDWPRRSSPA
jgi:formamidopyrimidine-DNA glycosylase